MEGSNRLPQAYAMRLEAYGIEVDNGIVQVGSSGHTEATRMQRMMRHSEFDGEVIKGQKYVLLDDVFTSGGTMNDLRKYIESKGGVVVGCTAIAHGMFGKQIAPKEETIKKVYDKFGEGIDDELFIGGIGYDVRSCTEKHLQYILHAFKTLDDFRNKRIKEEEH